MAAIMWQNVKDLLILPFLDINLIKFDLSIQRRSQTKDKITYDAGQALKEHKVGVKCATISPDEVSAKEFYLEKIYKSPNETIRNILGGTQFTEPILISNIPKIIKNWVKPIIIASPTTESINHA